MADGAPLALPRCVFVLGKGGVGRSSIAAALGLRLAERGERVLLLQWSLADDIGPWFGAPTAGATPVELRPGLSTLNFSLDEALRAYFVDHLHLGIVYRRLLRARPVAGLLELASGLAEMFFLGEVWWLTTAYAEREAGLRFDRILVDAPATGHGASLLDVPATLMGMGAAGPLATETRRVLDLLADPRRSGALIVTLAEPLVIDETLELWPRVASRLGRPPLSLIVNRSAAGLAGTASASSAGLARYSPAAQSALEGLRAELQSRAAAERGLWARLPRGLSVPEIAAAGPIELLHAIGDALGPLS